MSTQERSHDKLATSFALGKTQSQATFTTSHAEIHPAPPSQNTMWHLAGIWYSKAVTSGYWHPSTWACSQRMLKLPSAHSSHPPSSVKSVSHSPRPVTNTAWTKGIQIHSKISPERYEQPQDSAGIQKSWWLFPAWMWKPLAFQPGPLCPCWDLFVDHNDTSQTEVQHVHRGGRDPDASKISHRLDSEYEILRDFCKTLPGKKTPRYALPGKILGLEQKNPFFPDLSQDLLPWEGSSSSTHTLTANTYANSIQLTT